jgi:DNA/RNA endonuclease G (NUC1)
LPRILLGHASLMAQCLTPRLAIKEKEEVSVLGGPVFHDDDREFKKIKLPREFWKLIVIIENQKL